MASEIMFAKASDAVRWSQECAAIPDIGSQLTKWQKHEGGRLTREEVRDIAQTISTIVLDIKPWVGEALVAVYAGHDHQRDVYLGEEIGQQLMKTKTGKRKSPGKLHRLGYTVIKSERAKRLYGDKYWFKRMAADIGIHVDTLRKETSWFELLSRAMEILRQWLDHGERAVKLKLQTLGWMA